MRKSLLVALLLAGCAKAGEDAGTLSQPLGAPLAVTIQSLTRLVPEGAIAPKLSPDGEWVAYSAPRYQGISVASIATGETRRLTDRPAAGFGFSWSPDSRQIAFVTRDDEGAAELHLVARDGGASRMIHQSPAAAALPFGQFDADGTLLYVDSEAVRERDHLGPRMILPQQPRVLAAARAGQLVVAGDEGVMLSSRDGLSNRMVFPGEQFVDPHLSADGSLLLVQELSAFGTGLWSLDLVTGQGSLLGRYDRGCALADSGTVLAETNENDSYDLTRGDLWVMRRDGSGRVHVDLPSELLPHRSDCALGADRIAFTDERTGAVWVADLQVEVMP